MVIFHSYVSLPEGTMIMEPSLSPVDAHFQHIPKQFTTCFLAKPSSQFMCVQLQFTVFWLAKPPIHVGKCLTFLLLKPPSLFGCPTSKAPRLQAPFLQRGIDDPSQVLWVFGRHLRGSPVGNSSKNGRQFTSEFIGTLHLVATDWKEKESYINSISGI